MIPKITVRRRTNGKNVIACRRRQSGPRPFTWRWFFRWEHRSSEYQFTSPEKIFLAKKILLHFSMNYASLISHFFSSRHASTSSQFFTECDVAEKWMKEREDQLNTHFAQSDFKLDEGENLLKEMQHLRDELSQYEDEVQRLIETAGEIGNVKLLKSAARWQLCTC